MKKNSFKKVLLFFVLTIAIGFLFFSLPVIAAAPAKPANSTIEAIDYDPGFSKVATTVAPNDIAPDFTSLGGSFKAGDSLGFNLNFGDGGFKTLLALISLKEVDAGKTINVYVDDLRTTNRIATISIEHSSNAMFDDIRVFRECYTPVTRNLTGEHVVYFEFSEDSNLNIDWFVFSTYNGTETRAQKDERMQWWRDAQYGQFIHWGAYSMYGGIYNSGSPSGEAEWIQWRARAGGATGTQVGIPRDEYAEMAKKFNPVNFDPAEIVSLAKDAGQKYIVFTARHHEGFSMYDTQIRNFKDYSLMSLGDYTGPDPVASLKAECDKQGIKFCTYMTIMEWHDPTMVYDILTHPDQNNGVQIANDPVTGVSLKEEYKTRLKAQLRELISKYDIEVAWFDGEWNTDWWTVQDGLDLYKFLRTVKPSIIVNNRITYPRVSLESDFGTPERTFGLGSQYDWESCITLNGSWGFHQTDFNWNDPNTVINQVLQCASRDGNLLLNIGPDSLGNVPMPSQNILRDAGKYITKYGDAIYGTTRNVFTTLPSWMYCTVKGNNAFLHMTDKPDGRAYAMIDNLVGNPVQEVHLFGEEAPIPFIVTEENVVIDMSGLGLTDRACIVVEYNKPPVRNRTDLAANQYAGATSWMRAQPPFNAIDGANLTAYWRSQDTDLTPWLEVDLGLPLTFNQSFIRAYGTGTTSGFQIEYRNSEEDPWQIAYTGTTLSTATSGSTFDFPAVTGRYVRLNILSRDSGTFGLYRFELFHRIDTPSKPQVAITSAPTSTGEYLTFPITISGTSSLAEEIELTVSGKTVLITPTENGNWSYIARDTLTDALDAFAVIRDIDGKIVDMSALSFKIVPMPLVGILAPVIESRGGTANFTLSTAATGGAWSNSTGFSSINNRLSTSSVGAGRTATTTFSGNKFWIVGVRGPQYGDATVTVDGVEIGVADFLFPGGYRIGRQVIYESPILEDGEHTVVLTTRGAQILLDSMIYSRVSVIPNNIIRDHNANVAVKLLGATYAGSNVKVNLLGKEAASVAGEALFGIQKSDIPTAGLQQVKVYIDEDLKETAWLVVGEWFRADILDGKITTKYENASESAVNGLFILAVYKDDKLVLVQSKDFSAAASDSVTYTFPVDLSEYSAKDYSFKTFCWQTNYIPLAPNVNVK